MVTTTRSLGDLPDELLLQIFGLLPAQRDLGSVCLVSRRMNTVADPVLYKNIMFGQPKHHLTFSESLVTRPRRGSLIQEIRLEYPGSELEELLRFSGGPHRNYKIDGFSHTLSTMSNLETLVISVPESLAHGIGTVFNGPFDLACLKICTLFYEREDGGYWDLQENIHIFSHPNLEVLTIRRAKLDERGFESLEKPEMTALKELNFIECDINDDALTDILLHPEALKEFTMKQLAVPSPELSETAEYIGDYIMALQSAQHSLETIVIDVPTLRGKHALRMREFDALTTLELRDFQLFGTRSPRLHSVGLPPNLETLEFFNQPGKDEEILDLLCYTLENMDFFARKLEQLIVAEGEGDLPQQFVEACARSEHFILSVR